MFGYTWIELLWIASAAIVLDWLIGDPRWIPHPVIWIGKWICFLEMRLLRRTKTDQNRKIGAESAFAVQGDQTSSIKQPRMLPSPQDRKTGRARKKEERIAGLMLLLLTLGIAAGLTFAAAALAHQIHPWLGYAVSVWLVASALAVKGLKDAALQVWQPLTKGDLQQARQQVGMIVGRDTDQLDEKEVVRATVETVAENIVDAFVSPLFFALIGGAPGAMLYRAANTLDSMVGYQNEKYQHFGWASARFDDWLNWIPARITGLLLIAAASVLPSMSGKRAAKSIRQFAHLHPSPNSGIAEAGAAGALGVQLGGVNTYDGAASVRAHMGWRLRPLAANDILLVNRLLIAVSIICLGGLQCVIWVVL